MTGWMWKQSNKKTSPQKNVEQMEKEPVVQITKGMSLGGLVGGKTATEGKIHAAAESIFSLLMCRFILHNAANVSRSNQLSLQADFFAA